MILLIQVGKDILNTRVGLQYFCVPFQPVAVSMSRCVCWSLSLLVLCASLLGLSLGLFPSSALRQCSGFSPFVLQGAAAGIGLPDKKIDPSQPGPCNPTARVGTVRPSDTPWVGPVTRRLASNWPRGLVFRRCGAGRNRVGSGGNLSGMEILGENVKVFHLSQCLLVFPGRS